MLTKKIKIIVGLLISLFAMWVLFWIAFTWPSLKVANDFIENPHSNFIVRVTFNENKLIYEYWDEPSNKFKPISGQQNSLYVPKYVNTQLQFLSEDKIYKIESTELGINLDVIPGLKITKDINPRTVDGHIITYKIITNEESWLFNIEFVEKEVLQNLFTQSFK